MSVKTRTQVLDDLVDILSLDDQRWLSEQLLRLLDDEPFDFKASQPESDIWDDDDEPLPESATLALMSYQVPIMIEPLEEGGFYAECPILSGCHVEGSTYLEALEYLEDAIRIHIEGRLEFGQPLPPELAQMTQPKPFSQQLPVMVGV
jgi:predicted RNase H-like HicB family nuclease